MTIRRSRHRALRNPLPRHAAGILAIGLGASLAGPAAGQIIIGGETLNRPAVVVDFSALGERAGRITPVATDAAIRPFTPPRPEHKPGGGAAAAAAEPATAGPAPEPKPAPPAAPDQVARAPIAPPAPLTRPETPGTAAPEAPAEPSAAAPAPTPAEPQVASVPDEAEPIGVLPEGGFTIAFEPGSEALGDAGGRLLVGLAQRMADNPELRLEVRAYAGGTPETAGQARRLSLNRALTVRSFLIDRGVRGTRIDVRALGNTAPEGSQERVDLRFSK